MKEEINLLPPTAQAQRRSGLYYKRARGIYVSLIVALGIVGLGYGISYGVLWWLGSPDQQNAEHVEESAIEGRVRETNTSVLLVRNTFRDHPAWSLQIAEVLAAVPAGIVVTGIDVETVTQTIEVNGLSTSRSSVVQLEDRLKTLPWVKSVDAPLQNFASGPNVSFRFSIVRNL